MIKYSAEYVLNMRGASPGDMQTFSQAGDDPTYVWEPVLMKAAFF